MILFAPSGWKLASVGITTLGAYVLYWYYRNWIAISVIERRPGIMPALRAAFNPLWVFSCLRRLSLIAGQSRAAASWTALGLALLNLLLILCWFAGPPISAISLLLFLPLLPVNQRLRAFKRVHGVAPSRRESFTVWNWLWVLPVGLLQLAALSAMGLMIVLGLPPPR